MIRALVCDFSRVILFPKDDKYNGSLNSFYKELSAKGNFGFWSKFRLNEELLNFLQDISNRLDVYIFTTGYIQEDPEVNPSIRKVSKEIFSAARLKIKKADPKSYEKIAKRIGINPEEILYLDDQRKNIIAATRAGCSTVIFRSNKQALEKIKKYLIDKVE